MALQAQTSSPISEFGALVRRRVWHILLPFAFVTALGAMVAQLMPKQYLVKTTIKLSDVTMPGAGNEIQRDVGSASSDIKTEPLVRSVIETMEWPDYVGLTEKEKVDYVRRVCANVLPKVSGAAKGMTGSSYITVTYVDSEGERAARFLNTLRDRYLDSVIQAVRADAKEQRDRMKDMRQRQEIEYKDAEKARSKLLKEYSLSATQSDFGALSRNEDPITAQINQCAIELGSAKQELVSEEVKLELTQALFDNQPDTVPEAEAIAQRAAAAGPGGTGAAAGRDADPKADADKQIRDLELEIFDLREKLKDYRPIHSSYIKSSEAISELESKIQMLKGEVGPASLPGRATRFVANPLRASYQTTLDDCKTKIAQLKGTIATLTARIATLKVDENVRKDVYTELNYLNQAVEVARLTFEDTDQEYVRLKFRVELLSGPEANPYDVIEVAVASEVPNAPNIPLFVAISAALGLAVGLGTALGGEFLRNGYRSASDLSRGLGTPVLASVNTITTRAQARRTMTRHVMIAASSAVIVGAILWVTWAYQNDPLRLLGPRLTQIIENVRLAFRP